MCVCVCVYIYIYIYINVPLLRNFCFTLMNFFNSFIKISSIHTNYFRVKKVRPFNKKHSDS